MTITTKYSLNDNVWYIHNSPEKIWRDCGACLGVGKITLPNGDRKCPDCWGERGNFIYGADRWCVEHKLTIGQIRVEYTNLRTDGEWSNIGYYEDGKDECETKYMAYQSGIGCGTLYSEADLFESQESAEKECAARNSGL